ncbi:MAG: helix-turn-helix domain-containing protein [Solirubrobacterales bacterium]
MPENSITIALTQAQIVRVLREAVIDPHGFSPLLAALTTSSRAPSHAFRDSPRYSSSLARGFQVLAAFPVDGTRQTIADTARVVGLSPSTVHRLVRTWTSVGILEQDPDTRRYGLVTRAR